MTFLSTGWAGLPRLLEPFKKQRQEKAAVEQSIRCDLGGGALNCLVGLLACLGMDRRGFSCPCM